VTTSTSPSASPGVQSLDRAFLLLEAVADAGGSARLTELAGSTGFPLPTIHRIVRSLVAGGYLRQEPSRRYALGPRLIRLGDQATQMLGAWAVPYLGQLVAEIGETANMAMLERDEVVYVAQVPSPHSMRMFTEVGRHVSAHSTGVGKALLSRLDDDHVVRLLRRTGMAAKTPRTITTPEGMLEELARIRERGYSLDDGEQESGVRCVALLVPDAPTSVALSVSGPSSRVTIERMGEVLPVMRRVAAELSVELGRSGA